MTSLISKLVVGTGENRFGIYTWPFCVAVFYHWSSTDFTEVSIKLIGCPGGTFNYFHIVTIYFLSDYMPLFPGLYYITSHVYARCLKSFLSFAKSPNWKLFISLVEELRDSYVCSLKVLRLEFY